MKHFVWAVVAVMAGLFWPGTGTARTADTLSVGLGSAITTTDPHFHTLTPNNNIAAHFFTPLIQTDAQQQLQPGLAERWRPISDTVWEFELRRGVTFSDGTPFEAADVVASIERVRWVPNSPSSFVTYTGSIKQMQIVDPHTIRFVTEGPAPLLPSDLSNISIVSRRHATTPTNAFNSGEAMVGTGPYKFAEYVPGSHITMVRNDRYWGPPAPWRQVNFRFITSGAARVAALLSGDVDLIDSVPTADLGQLKKNAKLSVSIVPSFRLIYLGFDHQKDVTPFITDATGRPLERNPLKDVRVRQALSLAVNRDAIGQRVLEGQGLPASQIVPRGVAGEDPKLPPVAFDADRAKTLLAEAGYPQGFQLTLHGPNDRYINDARVLQAVAQMWSRIGVATKVDVAPWSSYVTKASRQEYSVFLVGWLSPSVEVTLRTLLSTYDAAQGMGAGNRGRYSNPAFDKVMGQALITLDEAARLKLVHEATEVAMKDVGILPLHHEVSAWASVKDIAYAGRADQYTFAMEITPLP